jgi:hypothetical protein
MASPFDAYLRKLRETPLDEHTEHTGRSALEDLLNEFAAEAVSGEVLNLLDKLVGVHPG